MRAVIEPRSMHNHVVQAERATASGAGERVAELQQAPLDDAGISMAQSSPLDVDSELRHLAPPANSSPEQVAEVRQAALDYAGISTAQSPPVGVRSELHDFTPSARSSPAPSEVDSGSYSPLYNPPTDQALLPDSEKKGETSYLAAASKMASDAKAKVDVAGLQEIRKRIVANKMQRQKAAKRFARHYGVDQEVC